MGRRKKRRMAQYTKHSKEENTMHYNNSYNSVQDPAKRFTMHSNSIKITFNHCPMIFIEPKAYEKMLIYVDYASKEVGWLGTVREEEKDYVIEDVFLFHQTVHATETEITNEGLTTFYGELLKTPEGIQIANKMRFWGHSHVTMGTSPSSTDDQTMKMFANHGHPYFIRGIFNKSGKAEFGIWYYEPEDRMLNSITDLPWELITECHVDREEVIKEFKEKVREQGYTITYQQPVTPTPTSSPTEDWRRRSGEPTRTLPPIPKRREWDEETKHWVDRAVDPNPTDTEINKRMGFNPHVS